jgi:hypothetical protein
MTLFGSELCCLDLAPAQFSLHVRLAQSRHDAVVNSRKPVQNIYAAEEPSHFRFDAASFGETEGQVIVPVCC